MLHSLPYVIGMPREHGRGRKLAVRFIKLIRLDLGGECEPKPKIRRRLERACGRMLSHPKCPRLKDSTIETFAVGEEGEQYAIAQALPHGMAVHRALDAVFEDICL